MTASTPIRTSPRHNTAPANPGVSVPSKIPQLTAPVFLTLFVLSLVPPIYFYLGSTKLSIMRILLLITFIPLLLKLLSGAVGRLKSVDYLMMAFCLWMGLLILIHLGISRFQFAGMSIVELMGGYLVGRVLIRNEADYRFFFKIILITQLILLPLAVIEFYTNINPLKNLFSPIFHTFDKSPTQTWRNGHARVMTGFEHPILFGVFCAITVAPLFYLYKKKPFLALLISSLPSLLTYLSLSSAPAIAVGISTLLILWDQLTGGRWRPLIILTVSTWIFLSLASNRGPIVIIIEKLTFDAQTGWTRILIWQYGFQNVLEHPLIGIGPEADWKRPDWLTGSVDNFWLVIAMRYGFIGLILIASVFASSIWVMVKSKNLPADYASWRTGFVIALIGLYFTLATVHVWGNTSSFLMCFIGAGIWFANAGTLPPQDADGEVRRRRNLSLPTDETAPPLLNRNGSGTRAQLPTTRFAHHKQRPPN